MKRANCRNIGWVCITTWISKEKAKMAIYILLLIQIGSLIWGGFISELSDTRPFWMCSYILIVIPAVIWFGYGWKRNNALQHLV